MNWFSSSGFLKAAVESATNLTKSLIQDDFIEDSDADDSPAVPRLKQSNSLPNEDEEEAGITPQLIEFVHNVLLYPKTFTDFPLDAQIKDQIILAEWQERHARLIIKRVPELDAVRFKLCPTKMPDNAFWHIYFILVRTKLSDKLVTDITKKPTTTKENEEPQPKPSSSSNPASPTSAKIPNSLLLPLSPILDLMNTNENGEATANSELTPRTQELEEYFESLWKDDLNHSLESLEQHPNYIDPERDNYFVTDISFEDFVKGKVTSYPPSPKKLSPKPKHEKSIPSKAAKVIRSLTNSLLDESPSAPLNTSSNVHAQNSSNEGLTKSASDSLQTTQELENVPSPTTQEQTNQSEQTPQETQPQETVTPQESTPIQSPTQQDQTSSAEPIQQESWPTDDQEQSSTAEPTPQEQEQTSSEPIQQEQTSVEPTQQEQEQTPAESLQQESSSIQQEQSSPEPTQQEQTSPEPTPQDSQQEADSVQETPHKSVTIETQATNESLQDVISSLMQDDVTSNVIAPSQPSVTLTTEQDDDSFMNWQ